MIYVALLRGINVGGKAKVEMARLKKMFEALGCHKVVTYINSGNVIFSDERSVGKLVPLIEVALAKDFGLAIRVVLRDLANIQKLCKKIPKNWTNDINLKTDVMFLWDEINSPDILKNINVNPQFETVRYIDGALVWSIAREYVTRGNAIKLIKTDVYKHMTIRNINTVRKLNELMSQIDTN